MLAACLTSFAQQPVKTDPAILRQFMDMRFGMFVHWGR